MNNPNYQSIDLKDEGILFKSHRKRIESLFINPNGVAIELVLPLEGFKQLDNELLLLSKERFSFHTATEQQTESVKILFGKSPEIPITDLITALELLDHIENTNTIQLASIQSNHWEFWGDEFHVTLNQWISLPKRIANE